MIPHPTISIDEKKLAVEQWNSVADQEERAAKLGISHYETAMKRASLYRRTASAIQHEIDTGVAVCVCCFKPLGQGALHNFLSGANTK